MRWVCIITLPCSYPHAAHIGQRNTQTQQQHNKHTTENTKKADILQVPVLRPNFQESTALGAALAAGLGVGVWDEDFVTKHSPDACVCFEPAVPVEDSERRYAHWKKAVGRCLDLADLAT